ncbi:helix-turn-helix transcriptional regulator [Aurantimonas sp. VKM B-3413]|uniref:ArsR/SmtB family transcription factor n=1 Tax=Aurantimonas sp. VKM B-3413 TaxID=2779401 RepID=UPI001E582B7D|nr:helix-turn-helix domain-containing protein [Aurantimonas sp. VKM B-3413]MCB8838007.1 helix-turn-helix domain-containing protein [Aurantimonas sp. VKM B-3413]
MKSFASGLTLATTASLIGDVARANILCALSGGQALTAGELAESAGVSAQTASGHLSKLVDAGMISVVKQGRHRYFRLASPRVAELLETLMGAADLGPARHRPIGPKDEALRQARSCYDHMAGRFAVTLANLFEARGMVMLSDEGGYITEAGSAFFERLGLGLGNGNAGRGRESRRPLCRCCLDWSERRFHIGGRLGAALLSHAEREKWVVRVSGSRALRVTRAGEAAISGGLFRCEQVPLPASTQKPIKASA